MGTYTGTIVVNVSIAANNDAKAQERLELVSKRIDMGALEKAGYWVRSVDIEDVSSQSDESGT